jgi:hypothetical protein
MPVPEKDSAKRGEAQRHDWRLDGIELSVLIPLMLVVNIDVATITWYVVGAFLE